MLKDLFLKGCLGLTGLLATTLISQTVSLPKSLCTIPFADTLGLVLDITPISIENVEYPYNASIIDYKDEYRLFFRYDTDKERDIACIGLNRKFQPNAHGFVAIATNSRFSEDPRVLEIDGRLFVTYNDKSGFSNRSIYVASLDPETLQTNSIMRMPDFRLPGIKNRGIEKNWSPFVGYDEEGVKSLSFEYQINPRLILRLENPDIDRLEIYNPGNQKFLSYENLWPSCWGKMSGGTPGKRISPNTCLAFFHSRFREEEIDWYVMAAYTFENTPPFRIKAISETPILFQGIYEGETLRPDLRTCYPAGFVIEKTQSHTLVHVSCGWNDRAIKIITMDLDKLLKSLKSIN